MKKKIVEKLLLVRLHYIKRRIVLMLPHNDDKFNNIEFIWDQTYGGGVDDVSFAVGNITSRMLYLVHI